MAVATGTALAIAAVAAPVVGGVAGQAMSSGDKKKAAAAQQAAIAELTSIGIPAVEAQQIVLENPRLVYEYMPELETMQTVGPTELRDVESQLDPATKSAMQNLLSKYTQKSEEGFTQNEMADIRRMQSEAGKAEQARQGQIMQQMAARGAGGSGQELAARMLSSQSAANAEQQQADVLRQDVYRNALASMAAGGDLASKMREQEYGIKSDAAKAQDVINQFKANLATGVQQRNVAAKNTAQETRERLRQDLETKRADTANVQETTNKNLYQRDFENRLNKAQGIAGARLGQAAGYQAQAAATQQGMANIGSGVGQGLGALSGKVK